MVARWDDDARYRKALLNQGWGRSCAEYLQWERDRPKQQKRYMARGRDNKYGRCITQVYESSREGPFQSGPDGWVHSEVHLAG